MKKLMLTVAVLMGVSAATTTLANNDMKIVSLTEAKGDLKVKALQGLKFKLEADNLQNKSSIYLKNEKGEVFHVEYISKSGSFLKVFDLSALPDGSYYFQVVSGREKMIKPFQISTKTTRTATPQ